MAEYITRDRVRAAARGSIIEQASILRKAQARDPQNTTFLSHSSKDIDLLPGVIQILEDHGATVYVDKKDEGLPPYTTKETAAALRKRIQAAKKFILLTSNNSKNSRWVPWELGLSDGFKNAAHTVIFPTLDSAADKAWTEQEYLGIYDRLAYGRLEGYADRVYFVWNFGKNTGIELSKWLSS